MSALETVLIPIIDPVMNPVWVFLFLDERPGALTIVGAAVILVSVTIRVVSGLTPIFSVSDKRVVSVLSMVT